MSFKRLTVLNVYFEKRLLSEEESASLVSKPCSLVRKIVNETFG